jgi:hypothetical protein
MIERCIMCGIPFFWVIFPLMFIGMMILFMIFSGRRARWYRCFPFDDRYNYGERIRKLEDEIQRLKGK